MATGASATVLPADYDTVIIGARNGQAAAAIDRLRAWQAKYPQQKRIVFDLAAILDTAGQYEAALSYHQQVLHPAAPAYAVKAVAHAARMARQPKVAEAAYRLLLAKSQDDADAHAGLVYALIGQDQVQAALDYTLGWLPTADSDYQRRHVPMLVALAEIHELRQEWLLAASAFQQVLRFESGFRFAVRGRAAALERAGLPFLAQQLVQKHAAMFTDEEQAHIAQAAAAHMIRFGRAAAFVAHGPSRFAGTDAALDANAALLRKYAGQTDARFDRLVALRDRARMHEVVSLYQSLQASPVRLPAYAKFAVADAYLYLRQPAPARDLYLEGLREVRAGDAEAQFDAQISLMYAYSEAEQHLAAADLAERLVDSSPKTMYRHLRGLEAPNPEYTRAYLQRALLHLYSDRLRLAEQQLSELRMQAPFNSGVRAGWASLQAARERPRAALGEYTLLLIDHPESVDAAVGRAESLLSLHELARAKTILPQLVENYPENRGVQELANKTKNYESPYFVAEATVGRGVVGLGAESAYKAALYSGPLANSLGERFRLFSHAERVDGADTVSRDERARIGLGADFRSRDVTAAASVTQSIDGKSRTGLALKLSWHLSDQWTASAETDTNVVNLPAAALRDEVRAVSVMLGARWVQSESRQAGSELQHLNFSDGNVRNLVHLWWRERWIAGPRFRLDSVVDASTSNGSAGQRSYFNPRHDAESALTISGESIGWRHYQRSFRQKAALRVGQYWQSGFASGMTVDLRYEHEWRRDDRFGFQYGIGRGFHPYDGVREYRSYVYFSFFGRLK